MEIRVWNENGDPIGHAVIKKITDNRWEVEPHPYSHDEFPEVTAWPTEGLALRYARDRAVKWKEEAEADFELRHGEPPVGVMSETGFTIQEVEDE